MATFYKKPLFSQKKRIDTVRECLWTSVWCQDRILVGSVDGSVKLWDVFAKDTKEPVFSTKKRIVGVTSIVALQDGSTAIACFQDSIIKFFDLFGQEEKATIDAGLFQAYSLSLSPQEDILVSGNHTGGINVWSMEDSHEMVATINAANKQILSTAFSADSRLICSSLDGSINVIDMATQQVLHRIDEHGRPVRSVCFSADGQLFFSAGEDGELSTYDIRTGQSVLTFGHEAFVLTCDPSPDGRHIVSGSSDGKVTLWDLGSQQRIQRFDAHTDAVWSVSFNKTDQDGNTFSSVGEDGGISVFQRA